MNPRIVNLRDFPRGKALPNDVARVDRKTPYGNPFPITRAQSRAQVIEKYREHLRGNPQLVRRAKKELKGKRLACWCAPLACHAEVLLEAMEDE